MCLFLLVAFPAFGLGWFLSLPKYERTSYLYPLIWGFLAAVLVCTTKSLFIFSNKIWTTSFILEFLNLFFKEAFLPCVILSALAYFFSKDDISYKIESFLPLMIAFYTVFTPYRVFTSNEKLSLFPLFVKPVIYISMICFIASIMHKIYSMQLNYKQRKFWLIAGIALLLSFIPGMIEAFWHNGGSLFIWLPISVIYAAAGFVCYIMFKKETISKPIFMSM